ncbi:MAG TPA: transposase [Clostridiales bacterium]|nr:transposase [Clostridiales bacterium]
MLNWLDGILSSFTTPVTNGFTEGCNNKIKVLKKMHTVIIILIVFVIVSYICFLIKNHTYINKRQLNATACFTSYFIWVYPNY